MATQPTGFIDFMAFARGAEMAQEANWRDRVNQQALDERQQEQAWREIQRQAALPTYQAQQQSELARLQDSATQRELNQRVAQQTANILREAGQYGPDGYSGLIAARGWEAMQGATTPQEQQAWHSFLTNQAARAMQNNDVQGAQALLNSAGRVDLTQRAADMAAWNDPQNYLNPDFVAQAGGALNADGTVVYQPGGPSGPVITMPAERFAELNRARAFDATRGTAGAIGQSWREAMTQQGMQDIGAGMEGRNIDLRGNPYSGYQAVPRPPVSDVYRVEGATVAPPPPGVNYSGAAPNLSVPAPSLDAALGGQIVPAYPGVSVNGSPLNYPSFTPAQVPPPAAATPSIAPPQTPVVGGQRPSWSVTGGINTGAWLPPITPPGASGEQQAARDAAAQQAARDAAAQRVQAAQQAYANVGRLGLSGAQYAQAVQAALAEMQAAQAAYAAAQGPSWFERLLGTGGINTGGWLTQPGAR